MVCVLEKIAISKYLSVREHLNRWVLFNRLTLQVFVLPKKILNENSPADANDINHIIHQLAKNANIKTQLISKGYLIQPEQEKAIINNLRHQALNATFSISLLRVMTTLHCNLNCAYCKVINNLKTKNNNYISLEKLTPVLSYCAAQHTDGYFYIHFTGGEPLLAPKNSLFSMLDAVESIFANKKYCAVIGTNGTLVTEQFCQNLKKYKNCRVIVSCDGLADCHNTTRVTKNGKPTFAIVDECIKLLKKHNIPFGISMVIGQHNVKLLDESIDSIINNWHPESIGVNYLKQPSYKDRNSTFAILPTEYADAIWKQHLRLRKAGIYFELLHRRLSPFIEEKFRLFDCGSSSGTTLNIGPNGNISTCKTNIAFNENVINGIDKKVFNSNRDRSPIFNDKCLECDGIAICGNGCIYQANQANVNHNCDIDESSCSYTKRFISLFLNEAVKQFSENEYGFLTTEPRNSIIGQSKSVEGTLRWSIGHAMPMVKATDFK